MDKESNLKSSYLLQKWFEESDFSNWRELAKKTHVAPSTISLWKNGEQIPSNDNIRAICRALDQDPAAILDIVKKERLEQKKEKMFFRFGDIAKEVFSVGKRTASLEGLMILLESLPIGFFVIDLDTFEFEDINAYLVEQFGLTNKSELIGRNLCSIFGVERDKFPQRISDDIAMNQVFGIDFDGIRKAFMVTSIAFWHEGKHLSVGIMKKIDDLIAIISQQSIELTFQRSILISN